MSKFKVGDQFKIIGNRGGNHLFNIGDIVSLSFDDGTERPRFISGGQEQYVCWCDVEFIQKAAPYTQSNRHKLYKAIKATGYSSRRLSFIASGHESHFYNYTGEARYNKKGDISDALLEQLKKSVEISAKKLTEKLADALIEKPDELQEPDLYEIKSYSSIAFAVLILCAVFTIAVLICRYYGY